LLKKDQEWEKEPELQAALTELKEVNKRLDSTKTPEVAAENKEGQEPDNKIRIGDLSFIIGKESFVTLAEAKNTKTGNSAVAVRINEQLDNTDYTRRIKPLIDRYFGEWNSSNKVILFDTVAQANNFKIAVERDFPALNDNYEAPEGYKVQETPVISEAKIDNPDRQVPLMDYLDNGKQVVEIKKTQEQQPIKESTGTKLLPVEEYKHTKTGQILFNVKINGRAEKSAYNNYVNIAKRHKPVNSQKAFSPFAEGFLFNTKDDAIRFKNEVEGESEVQFRILGETGAANLDKAEEATTRLDNLAIAREMETSGKDAKTISLATGWEKGADGKWRYEVDDSDIQLNDITTLQLDKQNFGTRYISDTLPNLLKTNNLFKEYPELKETGIVLYDFPHPKGTLAAYHAPMKIISYYPGSVTIWGVDLQNPKLSNSQRSALLHEIQHAIQHIEGFAQGGSPEGISESLIPANPKWDKWNSEENKKAVEEYNSLHKSPEYAEQLLKSNNLFTAEFEPRLDELDKTIDRDNFREIMKKKDEIFKEYDNISDTKFPVPFFRSNI